MLNNHSNIAIKVEGLSKNYFIKHEQKESSQTFQYMIFNPEINGIYLLDTYRL